MIDTFTTAGTDVFTGTRLPTGNAHLDALLGGGLLPGILHVLGGPRRFLAGILQRVAVACQQPAGAPGGIGCERIIYALLDNAMEPNDMASGGQALGMDPRAVLERILVSRGFSWDQCVEIVGRKMPEQVTPGSVVLVSGLTCQMDMADRGSFDGLREMVDGFKRCMERPPVYMLATAPIAKGSVIKPAGGNILLHFAGCIVAVAVEQPSRLETRTTWRLVKHPLYPERRIVERAVADSPKIRKRKAGLAGYKALEEFI